MSNDPNKAGLDLLFASLPDNFKRTISTLKEIDSIYVEVDRDAELGDTLNLLVRNLFLKLSDGGIQMDTPPSADDGKTDDGKIKLQELSALIVTGETGAGKSAALDHLFKEKFQGYRTIGSGCPLITVSVRGPCTLESLGKAVLCALGYPLNAKRNAATVWDMAHDRIKSSGVRFLHLDEFQNATETANVVEATKILDRLKSMLIDASHPIVLILSGLPSIATFVERDGQVARRSFFLHFKALSAEDMDMLEGMIAAFAGTAGLRLDLPARDRFMPRLMHAGMNQLGRSVKWIGEAVDDALLRGSETLTAEHFATAFARRTGNGAAANPFVAPNYVEIDCSRVLLEKIPEAAVDEAPKRKPARRTRKARRNG